MDLLKISLLGTFRIDHPGLPTGGKIPRSIQILLAYLLLFRHRLHPREVLTGLFWGDHIEERARGCLSTALWRLRRTLEPLGVPKGSFLLTSPTGGVGFNAESNHWLDVADLEDKAKKVLQKPTESMEPREAQEIQDALSLYNSELLEGFFEDWIIRERERLRMLYLESLIRLMHYWKSAGAFQKSLTCGQKILDRDPLREEIHREVMRLYQACGQRTMAIRQYKICCQFLEEELAIPPMDETRKVYDEIRKIGAGEVLNFVPKSAQISRSNNCESIDDLRQNLGQTFQQLEKILQDLKQTMQVLERMVQGDLRQRTPQISLPWSKPYVPHFSVYFSKKKILGD